jgi:hypothetical protein
MKHSRILLTAVLALGGAAVAGAQGYGQYGQGPYRNGPYDNRGNYGGAYARGGPASQFGFEDGRRDGERDFMRRRDPRPERNGNFRSADRGYRGMFGDRRFYRDEYRAAYLQGYRMGYRGGGDWRR